MGTRSLTIVIDQEGTKKIIQYGQWDGHPLYVGIRILRFLKNKELFEKFKSKLSKVHFVDRHGVDKAFIDSYLKNQPRYEGDPDNRTEEEKEWFSKFFSRDLAEQVLTNIANSEIERIILTDNEDHKRDAWIDFEYVINLKEKKFYVYRRYKKAPMAVFNLDDLPDEDVYILIFEALEDDEDD